MLKAIIDWFRYWFTPEEPPHIPDNLPPNWAYNATDNIKLKDFLYKKEQYLKSIQWHIKKELVLRRDNYECQLCHSNHSLQVHHMWGYDLIPNEPTDCLILLCSTCHEEEHHLHGYPGTYEGYMNWYTPIEKSKQ